MTRSRIEPESHQGNVVLELPPAGGRPHGPDDALHPGGSQAPVRLLQDGKEPGESQDAIVRAADLVDAVAEEVQDGIRGDFRLRPGELRRVVDAHRGAFGPEFPDGFVRSQEGGRGGARAGVPEPPGPRIPKPEPGGDVQVVSGPVGRERVHFQAPPKERLDSEIKDFLSWWEKSLGREEGFLRAGIAHFWFVTVHPFDDGNGRVTRALADMALAQDEKSQVRIYSFSSQIMEERNAYYDVLEKCSKAGLDITEWLEWFLGCLIHAMEKSEIIIAKVLAKAEFWQMHSQTTLNDRQRKVINRLLDAGQGQFQGGLTTRKYASMTKASRATAFREISDLVDKKILAQNPQTKGRNVSYELNWR